MNRPIKATVIILAYNQAHSVARAIDSVLAQRTPFRFEIIIGDDDSTDPTRTICEGYARRYPDIIRLMPQAPNKGLVVNYFSCLAAARGEFVSDCAGDDYWTTPDKLALEVEAAESACSVIAFSRYRGPEGTRRFTAINPRRMLCRLISAPGRLPVMLSAATYRREAAVRALQLHPDLVGNPDTGCEDMPLMAALLSMGPAVMVDEKTLHYSPAPGSVSRPIDPRKRLTSQICEWRLRRSLARRFRIPLLMMIPFYLRRSLRLAILRLRCF